ncbi:MAG: hypothetical protein GY888_07395, partial [Planctomycetaceae bacterium]|nr:hypothetical protein [Planctomycetaceae bacterium]
FPGLQDSQSIGSFFIGDKVDRGDLPAGLAQAIKHSCKPQDLACFQAGQGKLARDTYLGGEAQPLTTGQGDSVLPYFLDANRLGFSRLVSDDQFARSNRFNGSGNGHHFPDD